MNTDPSVPHRRPDLAAKAADPNTDMETLRTLAAEYPALRATIALNPNAYDGLVDWLEQTGDPQVQAAVAQRRASGPVWDPPAASNGTDVEASIDEDAASEHAAETVPESAAEPTAVADATAETDPDVSPEASPQAAASNSTQSAESGAASPTESGAEFDAEATSVLNRDDLASAETVVGVGAAGAFAASPSAASASSAGSPGSATSAPSAAPVFVPAAASSGQTPPPQQTQGGGSDDGRRKRSLLLAALIALALLAVLLVAPMFFLLSREKSPQEEVSSAPEATASASAVSAAPSASATETASASPSPSPSPSPSNEQAKFPAPSDAVSAPTIASPSHNLVCQLGEDTVTCIAKEQDESPMGATCGAKPLTLSANRDGTALACDVPVYEAGAKVLDFGKSATYGHTACTSTYNGVSCWNTITGKALAISRQGWQAGTSGAIPESSFAWTK